MISSLRIPLATRVAICLLALMGASLASAQQVLQLGRTEFPSPLSDVVERVVSEALSRRGLSAQFNKMPLLRSINMSNEGALDGDLLRIADAAKNFQNLVAVPTPVAMIHVAIYGNDPALVNLPRKELAKHKVGLTRGTLALVKHSEGMSVTDTQTLGTTFDMLKNKRFDIAMMIYVDAELEIAKHNLTGIARRPSYWASEPAHLFLNKKHKDLIPTINSALLEMQKEGLIGKYYAEGMRKIGVKDLAPASQ